MIISDEEYATLKANAERYKWLREGALTSKDVYTPFWHYTKIVRPATRMHNQTVRGPALDALIDADMRLYQIELCCQIVYQSDRGYPDSAANDELEKRGWKPMTMIEADKNWDPNLIGVAREAAEKAGLKLCGEDINEPTLLELVFGRPLIRS